MKINPFTLPLAPSFIKVYETGFGISKGANVTIGSAGGNISITGTISSISSGPVEGQYLETDTSGSSVVRYNQLGNSYTNSGNAIVYNTAQGWLNWRLVFSYCSAPHGYLLKNKPSGTNSCATDYYPTITEPEPLFIDNEYHDDMIDETSDVIFAYNISERQSLHMWSFQQTRNNRGGQTK